MNKINTLKELEQVFKDAVDLKKNYIVSDVYIAVFIKLPNLEENEIIINPLQNAEKKLEYYLNAYNEDLTLKSFSEIKIVGANVYWGLSFLK